MYGDTAQISAQSVAEEIYKKNVELLEQRRRTEQLLYSVSEIVFAIDIEYHVTFLNHAAEKYLSITDSDVIGKDINEILSIKDEDGTTIRAQEYCFQSDPTKSFLEGVILSSQRGDIYVNVKTSVIADNEGVNECVLTVIDVTKELQLDKTKDDFISITSHELRTPITIIKSYLWMLNSARAGILSDKQKEYVDKAMKGTERMLALINDTLNVARIEQGRVTIDIDCINLKNFLNEFDEEFKVKTDEKGLSLKIDVQEYLWDIYADKSKLREIFLNLLGNSVKFTSQGGITIKAENLEKDYVKISITDTGSGIKQDDLDRLFHKFGRLDNDFSTIAQAGGTGLGLYIVKTLIEKMGGTAGASSEGLGKGSTFWFTVPAEDPKENICSIVS